MLSKYFSLKKFKCPCCGICNVDTPFLKKLDRLRRFVGCAIIVQSGCRCRAHNKKVGGKTRSAHITGPIRKCKGADIRCKKRFRLLLGAVIIFRRVGIAKNWLHVDSDTNLPQWVYWVY